MLPGFFPACIAILLLASCRGDSLDLVVEPISHRGSVIDTLVAASSSYEPELLPVPFAGMVRTENGQLYFIDHSTSSVVRFTPGDTALVRAGGAGAGPGDLGRPCCIGLLADGTGIVVFEPKNGRYSIFDRELLFRSVVPVGVSRVGSLPSAFSPDGFIAHPSINATLGGTLIANELGFHDGSGVRVRQESLALPDDMKAPTATIDNGTGVVVTLTQPFGDLLLQAIGPNGEFAVVHSGDYRVRIRHADGRWTEFMGPRLLGPLVSASERESSEKSLIADARSGGTTVSELPFGVPERKSPLKEIFFDLEGRLWVQHTTNEDEDQRADVLRIDSGTKVGLFSWPPGIRLSPFTIRGLEGIGYGTTTEGFSYIVQLVFRLVS